MENTEQLTTDREEILRFKSLIKNEYARYNEKLIEMNKSRKSIVNALDRYDKCYASCIKILSEIESLLSQMSTIVYTASSRRGLD